MLQNSYHSEIIKSYILHDAKQVQLASLYILHDFSSIIFVVDKYIFYI